MVSVDSTGKYSVCNHSSKDKDKNAENFTCRLKNSTHRTFINELLDVEPPEPTPPCGGQSLYCEWVSATNTCKRHNKYSALGYVPGLNDYKYYDAHGEAFPENVSASIKYRNKNYPLTLPWQARYNSLGSVCSPGSEADFRCWGTINKDNEGNDMTAATCSY